MIGGHWPALVCVGEEMTTNSKAAVPVWYWVIAAVALLWNLLGCAAFAMEMFAQEAAMASMTEAQKEWVRSIPGWIYLVYGVAVATGVAGCIGLLLRQSWAITAFRISLAAVVVQMVYTMIIQGGLQAMGPAGAIMPSLVTIIAGLLLWFATFAKGRGWLT